MPDSLALWPGRDAVAGAARSSVLPTLLAVLPAEPSSSVDVARQHAAELRQQLVQSLAYEHRGRVVHEEDCWLLAFDHPTAATIFALVLHRELHRHAYRAGLSIGVRVGISAPVLAAVDRERALVLSLAELAGAYQTLLTGAAFDAARRFSNQRIKEVWLAHGPYRLQPARRPRQIYEVGDPELAPLAPPDDCAAAERLLGAHTIAGWRPARGQQLPGQPWRLQAILGQGEASETWLGCDEQGRHRVFKLWHDHHALRSLRQARPVLERLAPMAAMGTAVVPVLEWHLDEAPFYVGLPYLEAGSLDLWVERRGGLDLLGNALRLELAAQVAAALGRAHDQGVVHGAIAPSNILIMEDDEGTPRVCLADFRGIAPGGAAGDRHALALLIRDLVSGRLPAMAAGTPVTDRQLDASLAALRQPNTPASVLVQLPGHLRERARNDGGPETRG